MIKLLICSIEIASQILCIVHPRDKAEILMTYLAAGLITPAQEVRYPYLLTDNRNAAKALLSD